MRRSAGRCDWLLACSIEAAMDGAADPATAAGSSSDALPRTSLKLYNAALDEDAPIDLATLHATGREGRLVRFLNDRALGVERSRAVDRLRKPLMAVSPRTMLVSSGIAQRPSTASGLVLIKQQAQIIAASQSPRARSMAAAEAKEAARATAKAALLPAEDTSTAAPAPASIASRQWARSWRESDREHKSREAQLLEAEVKQQDKLACAKRDELDAYRELACERQAELNLLKGELAVLRHEHTADGGERTSLVERAAELDAQVGEAQHGADYEVHTIQIRQHMASRLSARRPHLERKLAYLRSLHIELAIRLQVRPSAIRPATRRSAAAASHRNVSSALHSPHRFSGARPDPAQVQQEAMEVATLAKARMDARLAAERERLHAQIAAHEEQRSSLQSQIFTMGSAKRKAMASDDASLSAAQRRRLQAVMDEDHAEMLATQVCKPLGSLGAHPIPSDPIRSHPIPSGPIRSHPAPSALIRPNPTQSDPIRPNPTR